MHTQPGRNAVNDRVTSTTCAPGRSNRKKRDQKVEKIYGPHHHKVVNYPAQLYPDSPLNSVRCLNLG